MFNNFYLNENVFTENNINKVETSFKYFINKWRKDCFVINLSKSDFKDIYDKLKKTNVSQKTLSNIDSFIKSFRGSKIIDFNKNISNYNDVQNFLDHLKFDCKLLVIEKEIVEKILEINYLKDSTDEVEEKIYQFDNDEIPIRCLSDFDRFENFFSDSIRLEKKNLINQFFINNIFPLMLSSKQIDILDHHCIKNIINHNEKHISGVELFIAYLKRTSVKRLTLISTLSPHDKDKDGNIITPEMVNDKFNHIVSNYNDKDKFKNNIEINLIITKRNNLSELERFIIFDDHSVINIHGLSTLDSTPQGNFKKSFVYSRYSEIKVWQTAFSTNRRTAFNNSISIKKFYL
tara:strand:+ start:4987 stop:6027 length:1041 start_codon:yes stop_codon:yes gene_type:complete